MTVTVETHDDIWLVTRDGITVSNHRKKSAAKRKARSVAMSGERIVIQNTDGRISKTMEAR